MLPATSDESLLEEVGIKMAIQPYKGPGLHFSGAELAKDVGNGWKGSVEGGIFNLSNKPFGEDNKRIFAYLDIFFYTESGFDWSFKVSPTPLVLS